MNMTFNIKKFIIGLSIYFGLVTATSIFASSLIEVNLNSPQDLQSLQRYGFDIVYVSAMSSADVVIYDGIGFFRLGQLGLRYTVIHEDLEKYYADRLLPSRDDMGGYRTLEEIEAYLFELFEDFDHIVSEPVSIGESIEERPIWAVKISDNPNEEDDDEAEILFTAAMHPREVITPEVLFGVMTTLIDGYENDDEITRMVNEREIWFILCVNPDGYFQNEEDEPDGGGMWRKNRRENQDGTIGVDLNRNWGWEWGYDNVGSSPNGRDQTYRGVAAFSEPESQSLREFINEHEFTIAINFHGYGNLALYPWGYDYFQCPDLNLFTALSQKMVSDNGYLAGTGWETIYLTNGESDDWIYGSDEHGMILSYTPEVGTSNDGFWPDRNRVETLVEENVGMCLTLIEFADTPERVLTPPLPDNVTFYVDNGGDTHINWEVSEDEINPAIFLEIMARMPAEPEIDAVQAAGDESWEMLFSSVTNFQPHSAPRCFRFDPRAPMARLTSTTEILAPDTLWAWIRYDLSRNNNFALEITTDGIEWIAAPGLNTEDVVVEDFNHGPGLFRDETNGWERQWWDLAEWDGQTISFRFRYFKFGSEGRNDFVYLDDIGPLPEIEWEEILAENIEELEWIDEENEDGVTYHVRSIDAEGDASFWSAPAVQGEGPDGFKLLLRPGWSMVSSPVDPVIPRFDDLFAGLIERDHLFLLKDGLGRFYRPGFGFGWFEFWEPLYGYMIKMSDYDSLFIAGERMPVDTLLELVEGWSLIPYYPEAELPVEEALETIIDNVIIAKDDQGRFVRPEYDFNNMADWQIGQAYQVKLEEADRLIYPVDDDELQRDRSPQRTLVSDFIPPSPDNHSIILQMDDQYTGQIIMRDSDGEVSGMTELNPNSDRAGIAAWGQSGISGAGFAYNESFTFYWLKELGADEKMIAFKVITGDVGWIHNGFSLIELDINKSILTPDDYGLLASYPNPFNGKIKLTYRLEKGTTANINIYSSIGSEVYSIKEITGTGRENYLTWDASKSASGLYFAKITFVGSGYVKNEYQKLLLIR